MLPLRLAAFLLAAALLGGCATPLRMALTPEQKAAMGSLEAKVIVVQDEVIVDVRPSTSVAAGVGFGLIGALITSTIDSKVTNNRVKSAQELMVPFYASIEDIDFRRDFSAAVLKALAEHPVKVTGTAATAAVMSNELLRKWRDALAPRQNLMIVMLPRYRLSADFRTFSAETWVTLWDKGAQDQPISRSVLQYQSAPLGAGDGDSIAAWGANNAAAYRNILQEAVSETLALMRADHQLGSSASPGGPAAAARDFQMLDNGAVTSLKGSLVSESSARMVVLGGNGRLYSLPKLAPAAGK